MTKKLLLLLIIGLAILIPAMTAFTQESTPPPPTDAPRLEITGVNPSELPNAIITANVFDTLGQPLTGLTIDNFTLFGELADVGKIIQVESIADDNLPVSAVLVIDISDSMSGFPLQQAKEAAITFINNIGANDSVAIVTFASTVELAQDYTTDKAQLISIIENLRTDGRTALYSAGVVGVQTVVNAPTNRRVVILLSDGSEFGGASTNAREEALSLARQEGASFYTIGLGFGADRTYLQELANGTNGAFFESPDPAQLTAIYTDIAQRLRSEYLITVEANVPLDGTIYQFDLSADTPEGTTNIASSTLIAPVPIPVIRQMNTDIDLTAPRTEPFQLWYSVMADDRPITVETALVTDSTITPIESTLFDSNYVVEINPRDLAPGDYNSVIRVTDSNGDNAQLETAFTIASIPSEVTLSGIAGGQRFEGMFTRDDIITLQADVTYSQTPVTRVVFFLDGQELSQSTEAPYTANLRFLEVSSGGKLIEAFIETESGQLDVVAVEFFVNIIPSPTPTYTPSPTYTLTPTFTPSPTETPTPTFTPTEAVDIFATETFVAQEATQSAFNVLSTQEAQATAVQAQQDGRATADAEESNNRATMTMEANRTATESANMTAQAEIAIATQAGGATETAQIDETATFGAYFTETAVVADANMTATAESDFATQTAQIAETATYGAYFTETAVVADANMTATAESELEQATMVAQVQMVNETATMSYNLTATATEIGVRQTLTAIALEQTMQAYATETAIAVNMTATAENDMNLTATAIADITLTADYHDALTQVAISEQTQTAEAINAQSTQQALSATQTAIANITQTAIIAFQQTEFALSATATFTSQPTSTPNPTLTPITELIEEIAPDAPVPTQAITDFLPLICGGLIALAFLIMVLVIFARRNSQE